MTSSRPPRTAARKAAASSTSGPPGVKPSSTRKQSAKQAPAKGPASRPKPSRAVGTTEFVPDMVDGQATLSPAQRQSLKARAHGSPAVAMIGSKGLTDAVIAEVEIQLSLHGLIKVKAASDEREERDAWLAQLCERLGAAPVQHIGKMLLLYRPKAPEPVAEPPPRKLRPKDKPTPQERRMEAAGVSSNVGRARLGVKKAPGYKSHDGRKTRRQGDENSTGGPREPRRAPPRERSEEAADSIVARPPKTRSSLTRTIRTGEGTARTVSARPRPGSPGTGAQMRRRRPTTAKD